MSTLLFKGKAFDAKKLVGVAGSCPIITIKDVNDVATLEESAATIKLTHEVSTDILVVTPYQGKYFPLFNGEKIWSLLEKGDQVKVHLVSTVAMKRAKHLSAEEHEAIRQHEAESSRPRNPQHNRFFNRK